MNAPLPESPAGQDTATAKAPLRLLLAAPRGFCAGVDRAIEIVELALERYGAPVYVRHEIVHNRFVVDSLKAKGAIFVEELDEVPDGAPVVFSAHGVPKAIPAKASERGLDWLDATCPLVSKVHRQAERQIEAGRHILFIGHKGHPEVIGTFGQVPEGTMTLVETVEDVARPCILPDAALGFLTQTTLSVDDTADIVAALRGAFRRSSAPRRGHLLCHVQPPGGGQGDCAGMPAGAGDRRAQQFQLAASGRGCPALRRARDADPARRGNRRCLAGRGGSAGPHRRGLCAGRTGQRSDRPDCGMARSGG
jgi:(E)-4-hydroxy-3-methyl-but-2-enyl pyrophosphate reductase